MYIQYATMLCMNITDIAFLFYTLLFCCLHSYVLSLLFCYRSSSSSDSSPVPSKHQQEKKAFLKCSSIVVDNLSIPAIIPLLMEQELVNENDVEILISQHKTKFEKTMHLMCELPRKGEGFFEKFILCLCKSKTGTGHSFIIKSLTTALKEVKGPQPEENAKVVILTVYV